MLHLPVTPQLLLTPEHFTAHSTGQALDHHLSHHLLGFARLLLLLCLVDVGDVHPESVGLDELFGTGRTLVLQLWVVLHLVPLELVEARDHGVTHGARDVDGLLLGRALGDDQVHPAVGGVVDGKVREAEEDLLTVLIVTLEGRTSEAGVVTPQVVGAFKGLVTLLALKWFVQGGNFVNTVLELLFVHVRPQLYSVFVTVFQI